MDLHDRLKALYVKAGGSASGYGMLPWLGNALRIPPRTIKRYSAERSWPPHMLATVELLETLDPIRWPSRWKLRRR